MITALFPKKVYLDSHEKNRKRTVLTSVYDVPESNIACIEHSKISPQPLSPCQCDAATTACSLRCL